MKIIPDFIWALFWALPFRLIGGLCQYLQFIYWSAEHEFKAGSTWVLKKRVNETEKG